MLKIGVVGGGHIVKHRHIPVFKRIKGVEVTAICDMNESIAKAVAKDFGIKKYFTSLSEMLKTGLDVVDICTPPKTHVSLATESMEAGCNVLAEKPLAMTLNETEQMFDVSRRQNVKLCVVHQNLFNPAFQKALDLVKSGGVGDILSVDSATLVRRDNYMCTNKTHWCHKLPGGIFFEILPHPIYLLQVFLKNAAPAYVLSKKFNDYDWMKVDETRTLIDSDNGIGFVVASCNSPYHGDTIDIFGTKMGLRVDLWGRTIIKLKPKTDEPYSVGKSNLGLASQSFGVLGTTVANAVKMAFKGEEVSAHYGFLDAFVRSIESGSPLPATEQEAKDNVRIVGDICQKIDASLKHD